MPQKSAAASTRGSRFWTTLQSWLPSLSNAWAQTQPPPPTPLTAIQVDVTGPNLAPISTTKNIPPNTSSGSPFTIDLEVPVGPDRIFTVSGFVGTGNLRFQGGSTPTTLTAGQAVTVPITLQAVGQPLLIITTSPLPTGTVNQPYPTTTLTTTGGTPPLTWDPVVSPPLPNGLTFDPNTATIGGTPLNASEPTTHAFTVRDSTAPSNQTGTKGLLLTINSVLTIDTTSPLPGGTVGDPYDFQLEASGGTPPYRWSIDGDLTPAPGLDLTEPQDAPQDVALISGTPSTAGSFTRTYRVQDSNGVAMTKSLALTVNRVLTIDTDSLPTGFLLFNYEAKLKASGGSPPYTWSIVTPSTVDGPLLPAPGLSLSPSGAITGNPTVEGTFTRTYRVQDKNREASTKRLTITVVCFLLQCPPFFPR